MRKFLSNKAGATFNESMPNFTTNVRKEGLELIIKIARGTYGIINLLFIEEDKIVLAANWGDYFAYLQNEEVQLPRIEKTCPQLFSFLTEGKEGIHHIKSSEGTHLIGKFITVPKGENIFTCLTNDIIDDAFTICRLCLDLNNEIAANPPFPAWKARLGDLWE